MLMISTRPAWKVILHIFIPVSWHQGTALVTASFFVLAFALHSSLLPFIPPDLSSFPPYPRWSHRWCLVFFAPWGFFFVSFLPAVLFVIFFWMFLSLSCLCVYFHIHPLLYHYCTMYFINAILKLLSNRTERTLGQILGPPIAKFAVYLLVHYR